MVGCFQGIGGAARAEVQVSLGTIACMQSSPGLPVSQHTSLCRAIVLANSVAPAVAARGI
jgi:hypothetical protein